MESPSERQGLTQLGSLAPKIEPLPSNSACRQTRSGRNTEITGSALPVPAARNAIGRQPGGTTAVALPSELQAMLSGSDALNTDKALIASLPPPVRSRLRSKVNNDFDLIGYELSGHPGARAGTGLEMADHNLAIATVEAACVPANAAVVLTEITRCFAVTQSREHDETDMKATLAGMVDGLKEFPSDVIRDACRAWGKWNKWRPSLTELRDYCWFRYRARESLLHTLRATSPTSAEE